MIRRAFRKMVIEGTKRSLEYFLWSIQGVWNEEEDNETVKWREGFKNFERCEKHKRQ